MKQILKPIALNESSYNVNLLHKALEALGSPVSQDEVAQNKAGEDTLKKVRTLQRQLDVAVDESILVDEATAVAITELLNKKGLTATSRSFTVTGTVRLRTGEIKKRQQVLAFDLDLPGVAVYRDIENLSNIQKNSGFEFLGQTTSDNRGNYRVTFYDWQYGQAERKKADVVAYALEGEEIIGRSRLVNSEDYSDKGLVRDLDVIVTQEDARTEYEVLMTALNAFLKESKTSLAEIATSRDQLIFSAGELDIEQSRIDIAASAELLAKQEERQLSHELLYGIGRQSIRLSWAALFKKHEEELRNAIAKSVKEQIISEFREREITAFLKAIRERVANHMLDDRDDETGNTLNALLKNALPEEKQRLSFVTALRDFKGSDYREFWNTSLPATPEFEEKPELISDLLHTQQLTLLTANHQVLVNELRVNRELKSMHQLFELEKSDWLEILRKTGVPDFIEGDDDEDKIDNYADMMQGLLNATFPTQRIAKMLRDNELPIEQNRVSNSIGTFLSSNDQFDFAASRIHDFDEEIKSGAGEDFAEVRSELMKMQRVFQVSSSPEAMTVLMEHKLGSAFTIANIPRKSFIKTYSKALGSEREAFVIHERASHISLNAEMNAMHLMEYSHSATADYALGKHQYREVKTVLENQLPNYTDLFGSPDICECRHCRSVYSPAAYLVDLLRFLWRGESNSDSKTPLDMLGARRPDLARLPLTCENTNTLIPYIDLVNEVMEHYVANDSLLTFEGYDTGETTADELRANPQNFNLEAYGTLNDTKYPFTLPYHQPLDVIRTYGDHLRVSRYEALKAMNPQPDVITTKAIEAESLSISQEEYIILTGEDFDGTEDTTHLYEYYGYSNAADFENMQDETDADNNPRGIRVFLERTGLAYTDLVELVKTLFINPYQDTLTFLEKIIYYASIDPNISVDPSTFYTSLQQIEAGTLDPANDPVINAALDNFNSGNETSITTSEFAQWVTEHFGEFSQVITLYEPNSMCNLDNTQLRTIQSIYESSPTSGITDSWSKTHRFTRFWRKLGWTIHETDLMLAALGHDDITTETINKLESVTLLKTATRRPLNQLAVLWGNIDTYGGKSLYRKLFLNKAAQEINQAFKADKWGNYLQSESEKLLDYLPAIRAAFRIREEDLDAIFNIATIIDKNGNPSLIDINTDSLNLHNLSTLYRYVVLAKGLKMRVTDLCKLISLFSASPFSIWDDHDQQKKFTSISPNNTYQFYKLAASTKKASFKPSVLEYIFQGTVPAESTLGLDKLTTLQTAKAIRDAFAVIEQDHPDVLPIEDLLAPALLTPETPLTTEILIAKLSLTFQPEVVTRFMVIVEGTASFEIVTDKNLSVTIPDDLADKYTYSKGKGRLISAGVMSDTERDALKLANANTNFQSVVDELYAAPEIFISENFKDVGDYKGIFDNLAEAYATLLDHPAQTPSSSRDDKLAYVYEHFLPVLKSKLRQDAITHHIAALIGLSEEATSLLIAEDLDALITDLSTEGFSATYFNDATWTNSVLERVDSTIDFTWSSDAPDPSIPADNFSVRWKTYIAAPASGEYTLVVEVEEADESFKLYLDTELILEKPVADTTSSWEINVTLNATQMHLLILDYAETSQNAGVRLYWKTATTALEIIPSTAVYPAAILDDFMATTTTLHRAAKFILGFEISGTELNHFTRFNGDFGNIDFKALAASDWERIRDYTILRNKVPQAQALLTDVFALANRQNPVPTVNELTEMLYLATAWDKASLKFLVDTHFILNVVDFKNEIALRRLYEAIQVVRKTGISAATIAQWGNAETGFDTLHDTAQLIKKTVKAKYEEEDWLDVAGDLSDKNRENQKQALISYLLMQPTIQGWGAMNADGLFEYLLIDVQMGACMDTSRVVQASAAVQMFVNRCLLNLESDMTSGSEKGVSPGAIDKDRWEWMKNYRVWEANRKVFLYPENWLEPEWRFDRSEFFKELESYLLQNDITERSIEQGIRNYLMSLNEVANLEVCGMYQENDKGKLKYLHVFARTQNTPHKYFYRRWNKYRKWSAWESVPVDIRSVDDGDNSGVHLIPVVWKKRLFLFWPEFMEVPEAPSKDAYEAEGPVDDLKQHLEVKLAWSEYVDGKWNPKQISKEFVPLHGFEHKKFVSFVANINSSTQELNIEIWSDLGMTYVVVFVLSDIQSKVELKWPNIYEDVGLGEYASDFMKRTKSNSKLILIDNAYLQNESTHKILNADNLEHFENRLEKSVLTLEHSFFFSDALRSYFVRPVKNLKIELMKTPKNYGLAVDTQIKDTGSVSRGGSNATNTNTFEVTNADMEIAFGIADNSISENFDLPDKRLEFHTFYHPFSSKYVENLNQGGMSRGNKPIDFPPGLMESNTDIPSDNGQTFEDAFHPSTDSGLVLKASDFDTRTYYKENVCFDVFGANSLYNWELFFHVPLYCATRLCNNGKYEAALKKIHDIFDPTTDEMPGAGESEISRYWKVLPFKTTPSESLEEWLNNLSPNSNRYKENAIIGEWRDNPFDPHRVASNRPLAYMKHVVLKYVEICIAWGDSKFRQFTRESVNEALQLYVIANHVLGPRPEFVPKRGEIKTESYDSLRNKWDDFSNALVELENIFPYSSEVSISDSSTGSSLLGIGPALYFCIPANDKLLEYWDTVADRLFKIRHCQDLDGVERQLALFAPPIDPAALIQARAQGLSLGSILADLSSPPPIYRFTFLIQKVNEFCTDVKALGSALLATLEKKDAEELSRLRASHETNILEMVTAVRERQVLDAKVNKENLLMARDTAWFRLQHYLDLLGKDTITKPAVPTLNADLKADSELPADTSIQPIETNVDESLVVSDERGVNLILKEKEELEQSEIASDFQDAANVAQTLASSAYFVPEFGEAALPWGVGLSIVFGGQHVGSAGSAVASGLSALATMNQYDADRARKLAGYIRRDQDWTLQANLAAKEIIQLDKQITSADIRIQVAEKELDNHQQQIENTKEVELFLKDKFTKQELYQWMKEQLFAVYKQSYNLAYDMAKKAEKAYKYEMGTETASFIQYGYWDNSKQGLVSGEKLQLALRQLEKSYLEENRRELELTKSISLVLLNPLALIELRETGKCYVSLPEELFDLDFQGHYFRRIKSVSLSTPCIAGPYTTVNCSLRLLANTARINTSMNSEGNYEHDNDDGVWIDDDRFRTSNVPVTSIATSRGQNDTGMFEFNFRDERYLPFERAGVISDWLIELGGANFKVGDDNEVLRQFDYSTISDVIIHLNYTARENGGLFKDGAVDYIKRFIKNTAKLADQPLMRMFSMRHEFPTEWHKFLYPAIEGAEQVLNFTIGKKRFPFFAQDRDIKIAVMKIEVFAKCIKANDQADNQATDYLMILSVTESESTVASSEISMPQISKYGGLNRATIENVNDVGLNFEELNIAEKMSLKVKRSSAPDFTGLATEPREVEDIFLVVHYKLN